MTALERQMAAGAVALSKEHADRADAAEARWQALKDYLSARAAEFDARATGLSAHWRAADEAQAIADEDKAVLAKMRELEARQ